VAAVLGQRLTRRGLLLGAAALGAAIAPARLFAARARPLLDGLEITTDGGGPFAGDRTLLATLSPGGIRGRKRALVRFRLTRPARVQLVALARNAPGESTLAAETTPVTPGATVVSARTQLLRAGGHELAWTPNPSLVPGTYTLQLTTIDLLGVKTVHGSASPSHPKRLRGPVVRLLGIDAALAQRSYVPGEVATVVVAADAKALTMQLFRSGTEPMPTYSNNELNGVAAGDPQTVEWSVNADHPAPIPLQLPAALPSGVYYVRLTSDDGRVGYAPFIVRPASPVTRVAVVQPTNTWHAYNFYDADGDGYGDSWYVSWRIKTLDLARPHLHRGVPYRYRSYDLSFLHWLARTGKQADFYADEDLESFPDGATLRAAYDLIVFPGHEEYVTTHAYDVIQQYRDLGGNLMFLSSNNFFRRVDLRAGRTTLVGLWRDLRRPEAALVGVQYRASDRGTHQHPFVVTDAGAASFAFVGTGLGAGSTFGLYGIEVDATTALSPPGTLVLAEIPDALGPGLTAQMTYYETPAGARVFAAGVLNFGGEMLLWPQATQVVENVWKQLAQP
jgi:hypothetical protein